MKLKDNSTQEIDTALYQLEQRLKSNIRLTDVENSNASTTKINAVDKKLTEEVKDRQSADEKLQDNINKEIADRQEADAAIENAKQDKLIAGDNIQINGNVISATPAEYTAEAPVKVTDGKISLDTVPVNKGGTGATTAKDAFMSLANGLSEDNGPLDTEYVAYKNTGGTHWGLYTLSTFWNYIKGKISSVLGLTKETYGGKSSKSSFLDEYEARPTSGNIVPKDASEYGGMRKDVVTSSMTDSGRPGLDGHLLTMFWDSDGRWDNQLFISNDLTLPPALKVRQKLNETDYGAWTDIITSQNIGSQSVANAGNANTAGTADNARNMYYQNLDLSSLDKTKFYPLVCASYINFAEVAICSEGGMASAEYNQNRIHFDISTYGWSDLPYTLNIREYACYETNEITIGCIGRGTHYGAWALWLRGGIHYTCFSRNADLSLKTSDYTFGDETYTVGTNYYGGSNSNVSIEFTPQSTITEGAYSNRTITSPSIKASSVMVIPIGAPSSLQDGCIWIER